MVDTQSEDSTEGARIHKKNETKYRFSATMAKSAVLIERVAKECTARDSKINRRTTDDEEYFPDCCSGFSDISPLFGVGPRAFGSRGDLDAGHKH
jgi:hypothetical protein